MQLRLSSRMNIARYDCMVQDDILLEVAVAIIQDTQNGNEFITFETTEGILDIKQGQDRTNILLLSKDGGLYRNNDDDKRIEFLGEIDDSSVPDTLIIRDTRTGREFLVYSTFVEDDGIRKAYADVVELTVR